MQTRFTEDRLETPDIARANEILRTCVHCGMCTATCPTYRILGDELDGPRGRIYLIKEMLENDRPADPHTVKHIDRCLSCLACMTTCPSDVHYMHLVDYAREYIEDTHSRPWPDRLLRWALGAILPFPRRFRLALALAAPVRSLARFLPGRLGAILRLAPRRVAPPAAGDAPQVHPAQGRYAGRRRGRVALMTGCAQKVLDPEINAATVRLLTRHGFDAAIAKGAGCCGALTHHMGKRDAGHAFAKANVAAWTREIAGEGLDAIIVNASGCGTVVKDYGHMLRLTDAAEGAARVSALTRDIGEFMDEVGLDPPETAPPRLRVAWHAPCSLQHGQKIVQAPKTLLRKAGFEVVEPRESHLCCGSAGTYNLLQPAIAEELKARKVETIEAVHPQVVASANIGCMTQIGSGTDLPVVHIVQLLDWATGGPCPEAIGRLA